MILLYSLHTYVLMCCSCSILCLTVAVRKEKNLLSLVLSWPLVFSSTLTSTPEKSCGKFSQTLSIAHNFHIANNTGHLYCSVCSILKLYLLFVLSHRVDRDYWVRNVTELICNVSEACQWLMDLLSSDKGPNYLKYESHMCMHTSTH